MFTFDHSDPRPPLSHLEPRTFTVPPTRTQCGGTDNHRAKYVGEGRTTHEQLTQGRGGMGLMLRHGGSGNTRRWFTAVQHSNTCVAVAV